MPHTHAASQDRPAQTVLLVDDEEPILELARRMLVSHGFEVLTASDGRQALEVAEGRGEKAIDLLFTDIVMPKMGGDELARELSSRRPGMKVLYMSGYIEPGVLGSDAPLLCKPFSCSDLAERVESVMNG